MKIKILEFPNDSDWVEVKRRALVTVGKTPVTPPDDDWKIKILESMHSPVRRLRFSFLLENIPSYVSVHLVRHVHAQPYVKSQRNDRQDDYDRTTAPQNTPVNMIWDMNYEELVNIMHKRLCGQADKATREICRQIRDAVINADPIYAAFLVPQCEYLHRCPEVFKKTCDVKR